MARAKGSLVHHATGAAKKPRKGHVITPATRAKVTAGRKAKKHG